jgi:amino acid adenylation domain-containing protein
MSAAPHSGVGLIPSTQDLIQDVRARASGDFVPFEKSDLDKSIYERFEEQVRKHPDRTAVKVANRVVTYSELNQFANRIARAILGQPGGSRAPIALLLEKDASIIAAMLGVLKAGRTYVPLDPAHPQQRFQRLLDDAGIVLVITDNRCLHIAEKLTNSSRRLLNIDENTSHLSADNLGLAVSGDTPCYVIYTSGSTGQPKGVVQNHRNILHYMKWHTNSLRLCAHDRFTLLASCAAGQSVTDIYAALLNGAALYPFDIRKQGFASLAPLLANEEITVYHSSASVFSYFADSLCGDEQFPKLRFVKLGGEAVSKKEVALYRKCFSPDCILVNTLSATETGTICQYLLDKNTTISGNIVPVGYPVDGKQILLLNEAGQEAGPDEAGEIFVDSSYLALGYWRQPHTTSAAFSATAVGSERRRYRTGDLGRKDRSGCITYLGRKDSRVKISGHTIELAEVEAALRGLAGIADVAVVACEHQGERRLVAYVVPALHADLNPSALRSLLADVLPGHMVPSSFITLDALPRTPNGKIAREVLPEPGASRPNLDTAFVAPQSPVERTLAAVLSEVLGISEIGVNDNFFDLGGNSLMAARAMSRLQKLLDVDIPMRVFFETPTLAGLAQAVTHLNEKKDDETTGLRALSQPKDSSNLNKSGSVVSEESIFPLKRIEPEVSPTLSKRGPIPLSFPQARLWFLAQLNPASPAYNISRAVHIKGVLNLDALHRAFNDLVARHEPLHTVFRWIDDSPTQEVLPKFDLAINTVDFSGLESQRQKEEVWRSLRANARRTFDLSSDLPIRTTVFRCSEEEHWLQLVIHHIATDGWSMGILFRELSELYESYSNGHASRLAELPVQYTDFSRWQREAARDEFPEKGLDYWKGRLAGAPPLLGLPVDHPRPELQNGAGSNESLTLSTELTESLRALSKRVGVSLFMTLLAALQLLLRRYTGETDISVGTAVANRPEAQLEPLIGFFVNTLVLRTDLSGDPIFLELLLRVREVALEAYAHQDVPFERVVEALQPNRSLRHSPLFQVMFILNNTPRNSLRVSGAGTEDFKIENGSAKYDLTLSITDAGPNLTGNLEYSTEVFEADTIRRILGYYETLLDALVRTPDQSISTLPILPKHEWRKISVEWNDTAKAYSPVCIHELFEAQAARTPDAVAVRDENVSITYIELNRRANQLARHLVSLGVARETLVGVCMQRSVQAVVALLGILKAAAAYVPLDPIFPEERLAYTLEDSGAALLLTEAALTEKLPSLTVRILRTDAESAAIAQHSTENLGRPISPQSLAYTIYTSGSTGRPKGVEVTHQNVVNLLSSMAAKPGLNSRDRLLAVTTFSFDIAGLEVFLPLVVGAQVILANKETTFDGSSLLKLAASSGATVMQATPITWRLLLEAGWRGQPALKILCGGEALPRELANQLAGCGEAWNMYGPTETTIWSAASRVKAGTGPVSIGPPIQNTQFYILDQQNQPLPIGIPGELYIGGDGVARGYRNQPELTAKNFISNPFRGEAGARLYKTGDLVRYLSDGSIEFLGRRDDQVKIRGFRIELGEIEAALTRHPDLRTATVVVREQLPGDKRLVAFATLRGNSAPTTEELRNFLKTKLPEYMLPSKFEYLSTLPLTPSGKVDRRALPSLGDPSPPSNREYVAPRTDLEKKLARIWAEVLKLDRVGIHDNFFDLGGYSLLAVKLLKSVERLSSVNVSLASLFRAPTIKDLADLLSAPHIQEGVAGVIPIQPEGSKSPFFCIGAGPLYRPLALRLGHDQPFLSVGAVKADIKALPEPFRLEDIAACLVRKLVAVQPTGPYFIGGWCYSGLLAYEVAQQLRENGQEVGLLVLLETLNDVKRREHLIAQGFRSRVQRQVRKFRRLLTSMSKLGRKERWEYFSIALDSLQKKLRRKLWYSYYRSRFAIGDRFRDYFKVGYFAIRNYVPKPYAGRTLLIWSASEIEQDVKNREISWRGLLGQDSEVHYIPAGHRDMFLEPNVGVLADILNRSLSRARSLGESISGDPRNAEQPEKNAKIGSDEPARGTPQGVGVSTR